MDITGMSEEEYRWFVRECYKNCKLRPGEPVALSGFEIILINLAVSLLLAGVATLLTPKPKDQEQKTPEEETIEGQNVVRRDRFAPKSGFDSFQNVVDMGSVIPIVYCRRHEKGGITYGGIRVNTNLLWSQVLSVGGGQFFRGIFLVGEAPINLERRQIALGNNTLASYELTQNAEAGRISYYFKDGGRIDETDYELGVIPENDPGAYDLDDIYEVDGGTKFCQALQPSNQVEFGVYGHIGNNFGYKQGEPFVPCSQWQQGDTDYQRQNSQQRTAEARKGATTFKTNAGFVGNSDQLLVVATDDELTYTIYRDSIEDLEFTKDGAGAGAQAEAVLDCRDIAASVSSIQRGFDESINVGDLYRAGSAVVVCIDRDDPFISDTDFDGDGQSMTAKFKVIEPGKVHVWTEDSIKKQSVNDDGDINNYDWGRYNEAGTELVTAICSDRSQLFRMLVGAFSVERAFKTLEVGLHSNVSLRSSGITNFNSLVSRDNFSGDDGVPALNDSYQAYVDAVYCGGLDDGENNGDYRREVTPGTYSAADTRYSFFRILYRDIDSDSSGFDASTNLYGVRSATGVDVYNYLRFKYNDSKRREFRFMPVSSWEIRSGEASGDLYAIDAHDSTELTVTENGYMLQFVGEQVTLNDLELKTFKNPNANNVQLGVAPHDDTGEFYVDRYARIAEAFIYDSVSTTASEPEHKISYINIISENESTPNYDDMSIVGLNIRSSKELRALDQLSVYCEGGVTKDGTPGGDPIHLFPDVFQDLLTNDRFGTGEFFDSAQIDTASFTAANTWTEDRNYYFNGAISEKINLRTWGAERARDFLLDLSVSSGKFKLEPTVRFDDPEPIAAMYSSGNIIDGTLQVNYLDTQDRLDPIVSVRWREERRDTNIDSKGLFPQIREFNVRRSGVSEDAPVIQVDLSNFCTSRKHAEDRAKLECQSKRYITHAVNFKTVPSETGIAAGSIIKLGIETIYYEQPQNGAISNTGEVTSWPPLADGTHSVLLWDGSTMQERKLEIVDGKAPAFKNSVFCIQDSKQKAGTYKVSSVSFDEDGNVDVEALYWPVNDSGISLMTLDWDNAGEWEIS